MKLGERLKELRTIKKLKQSDVANFLNIDRSTYGKYETGDSSPDYEKLNRIANYFEVTTDYLLGNSDIKTPTPQLNEKDKKDVSKKLSSLLDDLDNDDALMFDGEVMDEETKELLKNSLKNSLETGKILAKQKFTPKKYRK